MDSVFAFQGEDYVIIGSDCSAQHSIIRLKDDEPKIFSLDAHKLLACAGENSDRSDFANLIQKNVQLYQYRNGYSLNGAGTAQYIRSFLAESIRSRSPYAVNVLLAAVDEGEPSLYYVDYLGTLDKLHKGAHGYCGMMLFGLLDNRWHPNLSRAEGVALAKHCVSEMQTRFLIAQPKFQVKLLDANGAQDLDLS